MKEHIVDLVPGKDGVYCENKKSVTVAKVHKTPAKKKYHKNATNFFEGLDIGLDFIEDMSTRVDRFLRLRG